MSVASAVNEVLSAIPDPEIPVVTIADLGILRQVSERADGTIVVQITPTYSGCPAMMVIRDMIEKSLTEQGIVQFEVVNVMSPAWTTDWITDSGRQKMKAFGIAPPTHRIQRGEQPVSFVQTLFQSTEVMCPRCDSASTRRISAFGSTACQEQWRCLSCHEPFDHFKCH